MPVLFLSVHIGLSYPFSLATGLCNVHLLLTTEIQISVIVHQVVYYILSILSGQYFDQLIGYIFRLVTVVPAYVSPCWGHEFRSRCRRGSILIIVAIFFPRSTPVSPISYYRHSSLSMTVLENILVGFLCTMCPTSCRWVVVLTLSFCLESLGLTPNLADAGVSQSLWVRVAKRGQYLHITAEWTDG